jgi:hypothetical protein
VESSAWWGTTAHRRERDVDAGARLRLHREFCSAAVGDRDAFVDARVHRAEHEIGRLAHSDWLLNISRDVRVGAVLGHGRSRQQRREKGGGEAECRGSHHCGGGWCSVDGV